MPKQILTDATVILTNPLGTGGTLSDHANNVVITMSIDSIEVTSFGPSGFKEYAQGMADATMEVTFFQDFVGTVTGGTQTLDSLLYSLWQARGTFGLEVRPTSAAASTSNPKYTMTARLYDYLPLDGGVGAASTIQTTFRNAGTAGIVRGTV